jgi:hypothetical protein
LDEARKLAKLRCPGIVAVHDVGQDDGLTFIVSDFIGGTNLATWIASHRPAPLDAARLVAEIAENLHFAHEQGFIHRDIKPANILIDEHSKPLITDFGIAATIVEAVRSKGLGTGTLPYMAPEQLSGELQLIDARTDLYALGVVLYELLTGRLPYQARTPGVLREQILFRTPTSIRTIAPDVPPNLEAVCMRCLAKHPADRFHDAGELATALRECCAHQEAGTRRWWLRLVAVAGLIVLVGAVAFQLWMSRAGSAGRHMVREGVFVFDGTNRIVTPLERFLPVILEAWVRPERYESRDHWVIDSDVLDEWGYWVGMATGKLAAEYVEGV